jgi:hypothetical protein
MSKASALAAKPCDNCRRCKQDHRRVLGVLLCPKLLSRRHPSTMLQSLTYRHGPMPGDVSFVTILGGGPVSQPTHVVTYHQPHDEMGAGGEQQQ